MDATSGEEMKFYTETVPRKTKKALDFLSAELWIAKSGWYLAGGTALALQAGHRKSIDLDFFTTKSKFNSETVLRNFSGNSEWHTSFDEDNTIYGALFGAKASFIAYPFFVPQQKYIKYGRVNVLQKRDIAVMKIVAISQRGKKRDFFDLFWCAHHVEPLIEIIKRLPVQYPSVAHDYHHILKALVYFDDAESDPDPEVDFDADWKTVKNFFQKEIPLIMDKLI